MTLIFARSGTFLPLDRIEGMPRPPRESPPGSIHHVMARGNWGQDIFKSPGDWPVFLHILAKTKRIYPFELFAYCLMSNHVHLLVRIQNISLSRIMHRMLTIYARYINRHAERSGHLFQDRFKSVLCRSDAQFLGLLRYIHLNPVKAGLVELPERWPWSGHGEYLGMPGSDIVDWAFPLTLFDPEVKLARAAYERFVLAEMSDSQVDLSLPVIGISKIHSAPMSVERCDLAGLASQYGREGGISLEELCGHTRRRAISAVRGSFIRQALRMGWSAAELSRFLNIAHSAVCKAAALV